MHNFSQDKVVDRIFWKTSTNINDKSSMSTQNSMMLLLTGYLLVPPYIYDYDHRHINLYLNRSKMYFITAYDFGLRAQFCFERSASQYETKISQSLLSVL